MGDELQLDDGDLDIQVRIHGRRHDLKDKYDRKRLLDDSLSHRDIEVMREARWRGATEEEFLKIKEWAERVDYEISVKEKEERNTRREAEKMSGNFEKNLSASADGEAATEGETLREYAVNHKHTVKSLNSVELRKLHIALLRAAGCSMQGGGKVESEVKSATTTGRVTYIPRDRNDGFDEVLDAATVEEVTIRINVTGPFSIVLKGVFPDKATWLAEARRSTPDWPCRLSRSKDAERGIKPSYVTVPLRELVSEHGTLLDSASLAVVFDRYHGARRPTSAVTRKLSIARPKFAGRSWRLVIRIHAPTLDRPTWQCELCGAKCDDASVVVGENDDSAKHLSQQEHDRLRKDVHAERDRVEEHWQPLKRLLSPATHIDVAPDEVVQLINKAITELEADGVRIQLPKELVRGRDRRLQKRCVVTDDLPRKPGVLTRDVILRFQVDLAIDGEPLTPDDLRELAGIREPLVEIRGKWIYVDPELKDELRKIAQRVLDWPVESLRADRVIGWVLADELRHASGADALSSDVRLEAAGLQELIEAFHSRTPPDVPIPEGLNAKLRHYQKFGFRWLAMMGNYGLGACLADDMGLGKTVQTLALLLHRREAGIEEPALLICPTSVMSNWVREAKKFAPGLRVYRHHGTNRPSRDLDFFKATQSKHLVITSYNLLHRDQELFRNVSWKWSAVILDEAQNIKNPDTEQSKAARSLSNLAASRLALTGTPVENGARDLWPIMEFLNPGMLGTWPQYVRNVASRIESGSETSDREQLREQIAPFILRRKKTDEEIAPELPDKIEQTVWCSLTHEQAAWYKAALNNAEAALNSLVRQERQGAILRVLQELKQVCNGVAVLQKDGSDIDRRAGKIERLVELLASVVDNGEKAIVFSQYPGQFGQLEDVLMDRLKSELGRPIGVLTLTGQDSVGGREERQKQFTEDSRFPVILISLRAGGTGLNLQAASHVIHLDRWWNAAVEDQATDRAWRIGQERTVHVHKFVCRGTLEERIDELISKKRELARDLLGEADEQSVIQELSQLDGSALLDVLRLDEEEAVGDDD